MLSQAKNTQSTEEWSVVKWHKLFKGIKRTWMMMKANIHKHTDPIKKLSKCRILFIQTQPTVK
jgi:hypothetical protein